MDLAKSLLSRKFVLGTCLAVFISMPALTIRAQDVTYERLLHAQENPADWLTYYGSYNGSRFSALKQIDTSNVQRLVVKWAFQTGPDENLEVTPLVIDGTMYITNNRGHVFALDAATGRMIWRYNPEVKEDMPVRIWGAGGHRGVSVVNGKVLVATTDALLLALDAKTGKLLWKQTVGDYQQGQSLASPPLVVKDKAIIGISTAEFRREDLSMRIKWTQGSICGDSTRSQGLTNRVTRPGAATLGRPGADPRGCRVPSTLNSTSRTSEPAIHVRCGAERVVKEITSTRVLSWPSIPITGS
jgi:glucose dehydrogenase